jgi:hypothetical protein
MIKKIFLIIALAYIGNLYSQDKTRDEVLQLIADDTCFCIQDEEFLKDKGKSAKQKQMALGVCLLKSYNKRKTESSELTDKGMKDFEDIAEEVGMKMASTCGDVFVDLFSDEQLDAMLDDDMSELPPPASKNENDLSIEVELVSINNEGISYIIVTDVFNKKHTFIIRNQFEGYKLLKKSNINKEFRIYYEEAMFFDLSERQYVKKKVINYLEKI